MSIIYITSAFQYDLLNALLYIINQDKTLQKGCTIYSLIEFINMGIEDKV